jgi:hypothetical protein
MKRLKKITVLILTLALLPGIGGIAAASAVAADAAALPTRSAVMVDGEFMSFQTYFIDGNTYFKLRDIAKAVSGTAKQFEVGYDAAGNAISLTTGQDRKSVV